MSLDSSFRSVPNADGSQVEVSVVIPCRNEAQHIERCVTEVLALESPRGGFEVLVIDGLSTDGTKEILTRLKEKHSSLIVLDNPRQTVPHAMNIGIFHARGEYVVRADVRCVHPPTYLVDLLRLRQATGADNVGGVLVPVFAGAYAQRGIALAYRSPIAMGGALRDRGDFVGETHTVYGGCFRRSRLLQLGMYDEEMTRNQDDELCFRLRKNGGRIVQDGRIKVFYFPRSSYSRLFRQFLQYGYWKVAVVAKHPRQASFRHFLPAALVASLTFLALLVPFSPIALSVFLLLAVTYFVCIFLESSRLAARSNISLMPGALCAIIVIHTGFGLGFLLNLVCRLVDANPRSFSSLTR